MNAKPISPSDRLIYALDGMTLDEAIQSVRRLHQVVRIFKVGPSLIYQGGLDVANQIVNAGEGNVRVFLDMKSWDIPQTVLNALDTITRVGGDAVVWATIHTLHLNLKELVQAKESGNYNFKILAITLLTSEDQHDLSDLGIQLSVDDYVMYMAKRAREFGCDGVICSGHEVRQIKEELGRDFLAITPGIRPMSAVVPGDDQKRVVTPRQAIQNGANYIVVGRPIRMAPDPVKAAESIQREIEEAVAEVEAESKESNSAPSGRLRAVG